MHYAGGGGDQWGVACQRGGTSVGEVGISVEGLTLALSLVFLSRALPDLLGTQKMRPHVSGLIYMHQRGVSFPSPAIKHTFLFVLNTLWIAVSRRIHFSFPSFNACHGCLGKHGLMLVTDEIMKVTGHKMRSINHLRTNQKFPLRNLLIRCVSQSERLTQREESVSLAIQSWLVFYETGKLSLVIYEKKLALHQN